MEKITVIFVLGAPGSGKGTQCKRIVEKYGWTHLSTGDLLRKEVQAGSDLGRQVNDSMSMGQTVPTELILELLTSAMTSSGSSRFLVDGFPRTLDQLMDFQTQLKPCDGALVLTVPEEVAIDRLLGRGRAGDNEDSIRAHMEVFQEESQPVIEFLADSGSNVHEVDAGVDEDEVWAAVQPFMESMDELAADREAGRVSDDADGGPDGEPDGTAADAGDGTGGGFDDDSDPTSAAVAESLLDSVVVCVVGSPGADEGTQCDLIRRRYGWTHLSTPDLLKEEIGKGGELGQQIAQILVDGGEVPDAMLLAVVSAAMSNTPTAKRRFVLEGFPRRTEQILAFEARVKPCDGILVLSAPESVALIRMLARGTGEETEEEVQQRIEMFWSDVQPMVDLLKEQGASVAEIDASGDEEEVYQQVAAFIDRFGPPLTIAGEEEGEKQPEARKGEEAEEAAAAEKAERGAGGVGEYVEYSPEQMEAVVRIQAAARGYQDRKKVAELRQAKQQQQQGDQEEWARGAEGMVIQAAAEDAQGGEEGGGQALEGYSEEQLQAVIRIQAAARGYQDRKMVERIRADRQQQPQQQAEGEGAEGEGMDEEADQAGGGDAAGGDALEGYSEEQVKAVIKIQAAARGYQDRKMVERIRAGRQQAAQVVLAGAEGQGEEEEAEEAAAAAAEEAERGAGGVGEYVEYSPEQVEAVVRIQAAARGYQDRKKVADLRQAKQQQQQGDEDEEEEEEEQQQDEAGTTNAEAAADVEHRDAAAATAAAGKDESALSYEEAVVRIQAAGRGYLDRKRVAKLREEADAHADEVAAAAEAAVEAEVAKQVNSIRAMLVVCGPSGVGKGTLIGRLMQQHSDTFGFSVSHTTRGPRPGEQDGVHYHFTNRASMQDDVDAGLFLEYADVHGNMYGTSLAAVAAVGRSGRIAVLDIDVQGATKIKASRAAAKARYVFVDPPSLSELETRLRGRGTETEDKVQLRLANATAEIERSHAPGFFDARVTNDDLDAAYHRFKVTIEKLIPGTFQPEDLVLPTPPPPPPPLPQAPPQAPRASILAAQNASTPIAPQQQQQQLVTAAPKLAASVAMPVRQYMDVTVVPVLREALRALNEARPGDPLKFVADFLLAARANGGKPPSVDSNVKTGY